MGIKNNMHNLVKQLLTVILLGAIMSIILIVCLFNYYENYVQKQEAHVIFRIDTCRSHEKPEVKSEIDIEKFNRVM